MSIFQVSNLLVTGGRFLSLTFAQPHFRKKLLCQPQFDWSVDHLTYGEGFYFFFYIMVKGQPLLQPECTHEEEREERKVVACYSDSEDEDFLERIINTLDEESHSS